jgi:acyl-CoA reductase-like NAD-dependent aldehyde dehydrogenase
VLPTIAIDQYADELLARAAHDRPNDEDVHELLAYRRIMLELAEMLSEQSGVPIEQAKRRAIVLKLPFMGGASEDSGVEHRRSSPLPRREDRDNTMREPSFVAVSETTWNYT